MMKSFRPLQVCLAVLVLVSLWEPMTAAADPLPSPTPQSQARSRWVVFWGVATPLWRFTNGTHLGPWEQPSLLEIVGAAYTLHRPWLELRVAGLFGQRLDRPANSAGALASLNVSLPPVNVGLATIVMNTPATGTNLGFALTFGLGTRLGNSGFAFAIGGQAATYPALGWPITLVLGPSLSYRLP